MVIPGDLAVGRTMHMSSKEAYSVDGRCWFMAPGAFGCDSVESDAMKRARPNHLCDHDEVQVL